MQKIRVDYHDGHSAEAATTPRAEVMVERKYGVSLNMALNIEHFYYLCWETLTQSGQETCDFETFLKEIDDANRVPEVKATDPTPETQPVTGLSG